ncbi:MAG: hypothetical protein N3A01_09905 [Bacteroidales bacterium]|nr:hypothetical protein [Bacteroidales bacterium]
MEKNPLPEKLLYTQTWSDIKILLAIVAIFCGILFFTSKSMYDKFAIAVVFFMISVFIILIFAFIAIRKLEIHPDKIIVKFPYYNEKIIYKTDIEKIIIKIIPGFALGSRSKDPKMVFQFYLKYNLNILWYQKHFSVNNFLWGDTYKGDRTNELIQYLKKHYSEILIDLTN